MEQFVGTSTEDLAFTAEFTHFDFKHHAGVVVEAPCDGEINRHGRGCRRQSRQGRERHFEFIQGSQGNAVHAGKKFSGWPERFHAALKRSQRSEGFGVGRVKTVRFEEGGQSLIIAFVEQAHGTGDRWLSGGGVHFV